MSLALKEIHRFEKDESSELTTALTLSRKLSETKHYQKLGETGIFVVVSKAISTGLNVLDALNGGMYYVGGKVELSANTMNYLIRAQGHSIQIDPKSDATKCILIGKRADNGDTMTASFSIEDAKKAGIYKNSWLTYPEDMLFARALSRLARRLFPDVIKGCYTEGEIEVLKQPYVEQKEPVIEAHVNPLYTDRVKQEESVVNPLYISKEQVEKLDDLIGEDEEYREKILSWLKKEKNIDSFDQLTPQLYELILKKALMKFAEEKAKILETKEITE